MTELRLEATARWDHARIWRHGRQRRGKPATDACLGAISGQIEALREHPALGRARDELRPGVRTLVCREHVAFYRFEHGIVSVLRVLPGRLDPGSRVP